LALSAKVQRILTDLAHDYGRAVVVVTDVDKLIDGIKVTTGKKAE